MRDIRVAHRRQFTGSVCTRVSMIVRAVCDNFSVLVRQHLWSEFLDAFRWNVHCSRNVCFSVALWREGLDNGDLLSVEFGFEVLCGNRRVHPDSPSKQKFRCRLRFAGFFGLLRIALSHAITHAEPQVEVRITFALRDSAAKRRRKLVLRPVVVEKLRDWLDFCAVSLVAAS